MKFGITIVHLLGGLYPVISLTELTKKHYLLSNVIWEIKKGACWIII
jgi:hypothetical protein